MERALWIVLLLAPAVVAAAAESVDVENLDDLNRALASIPKQEDGDSVYQINIKVKTCPNMNILEREFDSLFTCSCFHRAERCGGHQISDSHKERHTHGALSPSDLAMPQQDDHLRRK